MTTAARRPRAKKGPVAEGDNSAETAAGASPLEGSGGNPRPAAEVAVGEEESATLQRQLEQTRRDYERLFAAVPCFICVLDRQHRIVEANAFYRREFDVVDGAICHQVCKKRSSPCPDCLVDKTFVDGQMRSSEETLTSRSGQKLNVVVHTRPVYDDQGETVAVMEVFTDITEVKNLQRQLTLMGRAVAGMAHRIKNILMGLDGGIFVVNAGLESGDRDAVAEGWEMVERNVERVSKIVKDLLHCAKDRVPEFQKGLRLQDIVVEVRNLFARRMAGENIDFKTEIDETLRPGTFDPEGIHNLLCNLVANAIDACRFDSSEKKERHTITLRCHHNGAGAVVLEVEDDGEGIPDDLNDKVFEDFFSSKGTEGTGIGLLVVQRVAEEHGGKVAFTSRPGQGTVFAVTLPASVS